MSNSLQAESSQDIDEQSVIDYLKQHPDLLDRHPEVLSELAISHESGHAVSLVERQLKVLREENKSLQSKLNELVYIARENEELSQRFHRLSLELMTHDNLHDVIALIRDQIQTFFYTDYVSFYFADDLQIDLATASSPVIDPNSTHATEIKSWMNAREPVFGPFDPGLRKHLFNDPAQIPSCVVIPIYHTRNYGLLALGSKSPDRFKEGMGSLFLLQLGDLVSSKLKHFLDHT